MKSFFHLVLAVSLAAALSGAPQAEAAQKKLTKAEIKKQCEEAKKAPDYDTPSGRSKAKIACLGYYSHKVFWKEYNRHNDCLRETRQLCPD